MDTKLPSNVNDSDLYPGMKETPTEHTGPTEMIFCLMRCETGHLFVRSVTTLSTFDGHWSALTDPSKSIAEKDRALDDMERTVEQKFLRHCDKSIPLHLVTLLVAKAAHWVMRLEAHHPRQYASQGREMPQAEKDRFFSLCLEIADFANILQTSELTARYLWHVESHCPLHALIYTLSELRHRTTGEEVERAWRLVDSVYYKHYGKVLTYTKSPLHLAIGSLALKAWAAHEADAIRSHRPALPRPEFITALYRRYRRNPKTHTAKSSTPNLGEPFAGGLPSGAHAHYDDSMPSAISGEMDSLPADIDMRLIPGMPNFEDSPMDWAQWDDLLQQFAKQGQDDEFLRLDDL
ncbi:hypothetical protein Plec18167_006290 [Paecilomyces lecythidis]|uniref:Uncharacterized protein n=1 Tax=Paecilomyces lecythidis TaxID=3004212 RepID=A0ABR3XDI9_9EURO